MIARIGSQFEYNPRDFFKADIYIAAGRPFPANNSRKDDCCISLFYRMNNPGSGSKGHFAVFLFLALIAVHDF